MTCVFTYGSLMFDEVWMRVVAGRYRPIAARLADHARFAVTGETYPGMIASPGATVDGVLYLDVDDADVARLDRFEGDDYRRDTVRLACADGSTRTGDTYVFLPVDRLADRPWDPDGFPMDVFIATHCRDRLAP